MLLLKILLYQYLLPRHQYHALHMGRVDRIDVFAIFNEIVVCGNISTVSYVCGNMSIIGKMNSHNSINIAKVLVILYYIIMLVTL